MTAPPLVASLLGDDDASVRSKGSNGEALVDGEPGSDAPADVEADGAGDGGGVGKSDPLAPVGDGFLFVFGHQGPAHKPPKQQVRVVAVLALCCRWDKHVSGAEGSSLLICVFTRCCLLHSAMETG